VGGVKINIKQMEEETNGGREDHEMTFYPLFLYKRGFAVAPSGQHNVMIGGPRFLLPLPDATPLDTALHTIF